MTTREKDPVEIITTTEIDTEYDMIDELKDSLNDIYNSIQESNLEGILDKISYSRFLVKEIDDALSEEYENLRRRRFMVKKSK